MKIALGSFLNIIIHLWRTFLKQEHQKGSAAIQQQPLDNVYFMWHFIGTQQPLYNLKALILNERQKSKTWCQKVSEIIRQEKKQYQLPK